MATARTPSALLQRLRRRRSPPALLLVLLAYFLTGAAVPPGHMAAPLGAGTAFHLCPGDLRSAQILTALAGSGIDAPTEHRAHQDHGGQPAPAEHGGNQADSGGHVPTAHSAHGAHTSPGEHGAHHGPADSRGDHAHGAQAAPADDAPAHSSAGHHHGAAGELASVDKSSAEPGCSFAGFGTLALSSNPVTADAEGAAALLSPLPSVPPQRRGAWLRPPVRSPPVS